MYRLRITKQVLIIFVIVSTAFILSIISYGYFAYTANKIDETAENEIRTNTIIEADAVSKIISNKIETIGNNLQILANTPDVLNNQTERVKTLLLLRQNVTKDLTESYFWLDREGKVIWGTLVAENSQYKKFIGSDFSNYDYFINAKETFQPYYANVLNSVDGIPRIHIAYPVIAQLPPNHNNKINSSIIHTNGIFNGIVAATIKPDSLARLIGESLHRDFKNKIILYDRNGDVLYSSLQPSLVGKNIASIYDNTKRRTSADNYNYNYSISSNNSNDNNGANNSAVTFLRLFSSPEVGSSFRDVLYDSLRGGTGSRDFVISGTDTTFAYTPVLRKDSNGSNNNKHYFLTLSVIAPHYLRNEVGLLIQLQKNIAVITISIIAAAAAILILLVLTWNKRLNGLVKERTKDLEQKTKQLAESKKQVEKTNKEILLANEQLKAHDKMQREFINIAAHELRTPTQAIIGYSEILELEPENSKIYMNPIIRNARRLQRLSQDILDVTKIESQSLKLTKEEFDLNDVISSNLEDFKRRLFDNRDNTNLNIVYEPKSIILNADKGRIAQIISNLLSNAIKFATKEEKKFTTNEKGTIRITADKKGSEIIVSVKDTGTGIDSEILPRLFTKFASKSEMGGTGLGLFISKSIVEAHGGRIWAENNADGKGATFSFSLPINK